MYRLDGTYLYRLDGTKGRPPEQAGRLSESKTFFRATLHEATGYASAIDALGCRSE